MRTAKRISVPAEGLKKSPTGIAGLDEITGGGVPAGRPTLICGGTGCGKTLFATEFLVHGAARYNEPGVFMSFEESNDELAQNAISLGFDLKDLVAGKKLILDHVQIQRTDLEESGEYDLEALFIRLGYAIDSIGAKRVVLDTLESLFSTLPNEMIVRAELRRLFGWLKRQRNDGRDNSGARGWNANPTRHGRIRLRLCHRSRSSCARSDLDSTVTRNQVPWVIARDQ